MAHQSQQFFIGRIPGDNLKTLNAVFQFLVKISKDAIIEVEESAFILRALNDGKSAFVAIELGAESFFSELRVYQPFACKVGLKSLAPIFRAARGTRDIVISAQASGAECKLVFAFNMTNGITRTHRFHYHDSEVVSAVFDEENSSCLQSLPKVFLQLLDHLHNSPEIVIAAQANSVTVRSHHSDQVAGVPQQQLVTGVTVDVSEFDRFEFAGEENEEEEFRLCSKELRAMLSLCETVDVPYFALFFKQSGTPVKVKFQHRLFSVNLIVATMASGREEMREDVPRKDFTQYHGGSSSSNMRDAMRPQMQRRRVNNSDLRLIDAEQGTREVRGAVSHAGTQSQGASSTGDDPHLTVSRMSFARKRLLELSSDEEEGD